MRSCIPAQLRTDPPRKTHIGNFQIPVAAFCHSTDHHLPRVVPTPHNRPHIPCQITISGCRPGPRPAMDGTICGRTFVTVRHDSRRSLPPATLRLFRTRGPSPPGFPSTVAILRLTGTDKTHHQSAASHAGRRYLPATADSRRASSLRLSAGNGTTTRVLTHTGPAFARPVLVRHMKIRRIGERVHPSASVDAVSTRRRLV